MLPAVLPAFAPAPPPQAIAQQKRVAAAHNSSLATGFKRGRAVAAPLLPSSSSSNPLLTSPSSSFKEPLKAHAAARLVPGVTVAPVSPIKQSAVGIRRRQHTDESAPDQVSLDVSVVQPPSYTSRVPKHTHTHTQQPSGLADSADEELFIPEAVGNDDFDFQDVFFPLHTTKIGFPGLAAETYEGRKKDERGNMQGQRAPRDAHTDTLVIRNTAKPTPRRPRLVPTHNIPPRNAGAPLSEGSTLFSKTLQLAALPEALPRKHEAPVSVRTPRRHPKLAATSLTARLLRQVKLQQARKAQHTGRHTQAKQSATGKKATPSRPLARAALSGLHLREFFETQRGGTRVNEALLDAWYHNRA
jgi:hypothetical protein